MVDLVGALAADPEHHEMLEPTRTLLPIGALVVTTVPSRSLTKPKQSGSWKAAPATTRA